MKDAMTYDDLMKGIEKLKANRVPGPISAFFTKEEIKQGLELGILDDRKGFVKIGGYDVIDIGTNRKAVTADYV